MDTNDTGSNGSGSEASYIPLTSEGLSELTEIDRNASYHKDIVTKQRFDEFTQQFKPYYNDEHRKNSTLRLNHLKVMRDGAVLRDQQRARDRAEARLRDEEARQAQYAEKQAILDRAREIKIEEAARKLANTGADLSRMQYVIRK